MFALQEARKRRADERRLLGPCKELGAATVRVRATKGWNVLFDQFDDRLRIAPRVKLDKAQVGWNRIMHCAEHDKTHGRRLQQGRSDVESPIAATTSFDFDRRPTAASFSSLRPQFSTIPPV